MCDSGPNRCDCGHAMGPTCRNRLHRSGVVKPITTAPGELPTVVTIGTTTPPPDHCPTCRCHEH